MAVFIRAKDLQARDPETLLRFAYYADPVAFIQAFANAGVLVDPNSKTMTIEEQLSYLAWLSNTGADNAGKIKRPDNSPLHFNVMTVYSKINLRNDMIVRSGIQIIP